MAEINKSCYITFHSVHDALNLEKKFKERNFIVRAVPVPREISSSCGISVKFEFEDKEQIEGILAENEFSYDEIYTLENTHAKKKGFFLR